MRYRQANLFFVSFGMGEKRQEAFLDMTSQRPA